MVAAEIDIGPELTEDQARAIFAQGQQAVVFALLKLAKMAAEANSLAAGPSLQTPSAQIPPYQKPQPKRSGKKPGRKPGHPPARRPKPDRIDETKVH